MWKQYIKRRGIKLVQCYRKYIPTAQQLTVNCGQLIIISGTCHVSQLLLHVSFPDLKPLAIQLLFLDIFAETVILRHVIGYFSSALPHNDININAYGNEVSRAGTLIQI